MKKKSKSGSLKQSLFLNIGLYSTLLFSIFFLIDTIYKIVFREDIWYYGLPNSTLPWGYNYLELITPFLPFLMILSIIGFYSLAKSFNLKFLKYASLSFLILYVLLYLGSFLSLGYLANLISLLAIISMLVYSISLFSLKKYFGTIAIFLGIFSILSNIMFDRLFWNLMGFPNIFQFLNYLIMFLVLRMALRGNNNNP